MKPETEIQKEITDVVAEKLLSVNLHTDYVTAVPTKVDSEILDLLAAHGIAYNDLFEDTVVICRDRKTLEDVAIFITRHDETVLAVLPTIDLLIEASKLKAIFDADYNDVDKRGKVDSRGRVYMRGNRIGQGTRKGDRIQSFKAFVGYYSPSPAKLLIERVHDIILSSRIHPCIVSAAA